MPASIRTALAAALCGAALALLPLPARAAPCSPADLNGDGQVDFADYLEFLNRYDAGDLSADFNGDGEVDFADYLEFLNLYDAGCLPTCTTTATDLAAAPLAAYPFASYVQAFLGGTSVSIAVDPFKHPALTGKTTRVYITTNRTWAAGDPLVDVRASFQTITWPGGSVAASTFALLNSATLPFAVAEELAVGYDLIIDENANGVFDACDFVDGPGAEGGFYMLRDLSAPTPTPVTQINTVSVPVGRTPAGYEDERWYYPADIASRGQLPIIFISHGNGHQYIWYDFLGQHLASYGYIVVAHENNTPTVIPTVSTTTLDHTNTVIALQATLGGGVLNGHINTNEIYWIGHSRGGEGVAYAWPRLNQGQYIPTGGFPLVFSAANVKYIQSIAPVNEQTSGTVISGAVPVDFMLLYGAADGDVCGCPGFLSAWSFGVYERAQQRRNSVYIQGVGHNEFNCCGFPDTTGPAQIGRPAAQAIQKATTLASIRYYRNASIPGGEVLWRQYETFKPGATLATAVVDYELRDFGASHKFIIDDFQANFATTTSSSGGAVTSTVTNLFEGVLRDVDSSYSWVASDPFNGMSRGDSTSTIRAVVFDYDSTVASRAYSFAIVPAGQDTTPYAYLSFRAAQITHHPFTTAVLADQVFEIELQDNAGHTSRIPVSTYGGGVEELYQRSGGWQNEFETIKVRLADFTANGRPLDLTHITNVTFLLGSTHGTNQGRLAMDDLEFVK